LKLPLPSLSEPFHVADAVRVGMMSLLQLNAYPAEAVNLPDDELTDYTSS
jgi:hypothetical protein